MGYAAHKDIDASHIPVIDLEPLRLGGDIRSVADAIHAANRDVGFLYVSNHGIPEDLIEEARAVGLAFFRQPLEDKLRVAVSPDHRGFLRPGAAKMDDDAKFDLKESFIWGHDFPPSSRERPLEGQNQWPETMPDLQQVLERYFAAAHQVAHMIMRACAVSLDLEEDAFLKTVSRPLSRASITYYPPQDEGLGEDVFGVAPHTDFGVMTVLCQDDAGGLQVQDYEGDWVPAHPVPGTLVVNVGDLLARWSNGRYRSTPHRVINSSGRERLSLVLAFDPDFDTVIDPQLVCAPGEEPREEAMSCGDYLIWRFGRAFDYRNAGQLG
ncbi:MAG: 2OG-Fe(II) oxygenase [Rhodospirillaceae bacterium]|nr:2OG-Fe(II) oxygenase [Rhodospirillaceae bacterium]|tara:strand:- start:2220 stop:3191 length:972 start_codon:yes stop_codon:yes gene_type:complete